MIYTNGKIVLATIAVLVFGCFIPFSLWSQGYVESALIFSRAQPGGSARIQALGGTQNSLGGTLSSAYYNPAGLGMFNRSQIEFSLGAFNHKNSTNYLENSVDQEVSNINLPNLGIAFHSKYKKSQKLIGGTFGINFSLVNNFNSNITYEGISEGASIIDYFLNNADGEDPIQFNPDGRNFQNLTWLAYFNHLISPILDDSGNILPDFTYYSPVSYTQKITQMETIMTGGNQRQLSFSYGLNIQDNIYLGLGIGVSSFRYSSKKVYSESFTLDPLSKLALSENLTLKGSGLNITIGGVYRAMENFLVGLSIASANKYSIEENYSASLKTYWNNYYISIDDVLNDESESFDFPNFKYHLITPMRVAIGATYFIKKHGFISCDIEWLDFGNSEYSSSTSTLNSFSDDWSIENEEINSTYKSSFNIRVGAEYRLKKFYLRAGFRHMPSPYDSNPNGISIAQSFYSGGFGYRRTKFFADIAFIYGKEKQSYQPYTSADTPHVEIDKQNSSMILTVGIPF